MLEDEGIIISTATAIDIEKILAKTNVEDLKQFSSLKYLLSPLICRNKEDQEALHKIFGKLDAKAAEFYGKQILRTHGLVDSNIEPVVKPDIGTTIRNNWEKIKSPWTLKKILLPVAAVIAVLLILYLFREKLFPTTPRGSKITVSVSPGVPLINQPIQFTATIDSSYNKNNSRVDWKFPDTAIVNSLSVQRTFKDTSLVPVIAYLKNPEGVVIDSSYYNFSALCEPPPSVTIREQDQSTSSKSLTGRQKQFTPVLPMLLRMKRGIVINGL